MVALQGSQRDSEEEALAVGLLAKVSLEFGLDVVGLVLLDPLEGRLPVVVLSLAVRSADQESLDASG